MNFSNDFLLAGGFCLQVELDDDFLADEVVFFAGIRDAEVAPFDIKFRFDFDGVFAGGRRWLER